MSQKTEKPTAKKLRESAKKGQIFKNKDLVTALVLISGVFYLCKIMNLNLFTDFYKYTINNLSNLEPNVFLKKMIVIFLEIVAPFIMLSVFVGLLFTFLQTKFNIATGAIKINLKALNPIDGFKKLFSLKTVKEFVKSTCYTVITWSLCYYLDSHYLNLVISVRYGDLSTVIYVFLMVLLKLIVFFLLFSLIVIAGDFLADYLLFFKEMKMDKQEVKREHKDLEGNPEIKQVRKEMHQEILSGAEMAAVRNSEFILTNPTHIAIAVFLNPEIAIFPFISLRTKNIKALAVIRYAKNNNVPIVRYPVFARKMYKKYKQHTFLSIYDEELNEIMYILLWLRAIEREGIDSSDVTADQAAIHGYLENN